MPRTFTLGEDDAVKAYHRGTHRTVAPETTLARVEPLMGEMGITRIANVTGLDDIGVPVVMVCRPNSRSISVSQGKGADLAAAKASGLMEAVETYHAERITLPLKLASANELRADHALIDVDRLPRAVDSRYHADLPILWIEGLDLVDDQPLWLPYELVHTNYTLPEPTGSGCFPANTNGLASGNHVLEATAHGIYEVIERDALTLWRLQDATRVKRSLDRNSIDDPACLALLDKFEKAGLDVMVWDVTSDVGVACFQCLLIGRDEDDTEPEFGAGCHPAREVALLRALTEAAQARTTYIAGSRDDFSPGIYSTAARSLRRSACRELMARPCRSLAFGSIPSFNADSLAEDIAWTLERLKKVGIDQVVAVDLTQPRFEIPVVRVVVPGLEGVFKDEQSDYVAGQRAKTAMERDA
ncbi:MAG: YcaO-like family protein [Alphaproteobacteria bacterium]|nr:YcaO-like family protein [Alphaproteobacteria bacterium]